MRVAGAAGMAILATVVAGTALGAGLAIGEVIERRGDPRADGPDGRDNAGRGQSPSGRPPAPVEDPPPPRRQPVAARRPSREGGSANADFHLRRALARAGYTYTQQEQGVRMAQMHDSHMDAEVYLVGMRAHVSRQDALSGYALIRAHDRSGIDMLHMVDSVASMWNFRDHQLLRIQAATVLNGIDTTDTVRFMASREHKRHPVSGTDEARFVREFERWASSASSRQATAVS